jgi:hypothetical protein
MHASPRNDQQTWDSLPLGRIGSFWLLEAAQVLEQLADSLNLLLLLAVMRGAFHNDAWLANQALFIPTLVPIVILAPVAGVFVDRHSRRGWMLAAAGGRFLGVGVMALLASATVAGSRAALAGTIAAILAVSCVWQFYTPARSAALPEVVPPRRLPVANSVSVTVLLVMQIAGYVMGGILADNIDLTRALALNAVLYLGTLCLFSFIRFRGAAVHSFQAFSIRRAWGELGDAMKGLFSPRTGLRAGLAKVIALAALAGVSFTALQGFSASLTAPPWMDALESWMKATWSFSLGPLSRFTFLLLSGGIGAGLGIGLLGWIRDRVPQELLIRSALTLAAGCFLLARFSLTFDQAAAAMAGTGLGGGLVLSLVEARLQLLVPAHARGKSLSAYFILRNGSVILGVSLLPKLLDTIGGAGPARLLSVAAWAGVIFAAATWATDAWAARRHAS